MEKEEILTEKDKHILRDAFFYWQAVIEHSVFDDASLETVFREFRRDKELIAYARDCRERVTQNEIMIYPPDSLVKRMQVCIGEVLEAQRNKLEEDKERGYTLPSPDAPEFEENVSAPFYVPKSEKVVTRALPVGKVVSMFGKQKIDDEETRNIIAFLMRNAAVEMTPMSEEERVIFLANEIKFIRQDQAAMQQIAEYPIDEHDRLYNASNYFLEKYKEYLLNKDSSPPHYLH